ncbi:hypothetical protein MTBBW1_2560015 [Desulfamplus magnetovallimortis]|uniref:Methyltransferase type 11 domain-containing protein n=1 Tax=Desulfamplus magnetovallimortis TaxID=1246637 RepID=A0A1W1HEP6_9BACT|nr:class I SAM-dependent methyltransferase [Desulfamplus magnetovallimortis]SLM30974.1 hypothetical protein MTBBW1_2560015 [Desulfamplus magnetovallimortis]
MNIIDKQNLDFYNELWSDEQHHHAYPNINTVRCEAWYFRGNASTPGYLLDYGHGCGNEAIHFAKLGYQVEALEVSHYARNILLKKLNGRWHHLASRIKTTLLKEDYSRLPYEDASFDYINSTQVIYHLPNEMALQNLINEWYRIMKPGGKLMFSTIGPGNSLVEDGVLQKQEKHLAIYEHLHPHEINAQKQTVNALYISNEKDMEYICHPFIVEEIGWYTNHYCGIDGFHWQVLAKKKKW